MIREAVFPIESPNGVGLSPDEDVVYVADTVPGRLWAFDVAEPGVVARSDGPLPGRFVGAPQGLNFFDSLAVDSEGNVCVATIFNGGITSISSDGSQMTHTAFDDFITTNICFGGADLKTAYVTLSSTGRLAKVQWPVAGLPLNFHDK
jgi:gluconolactonase